MNFLFTVASFLTKNLLIPWQYGEAWFRHTLVDADIASNTMGWQWVAGCGADAAPYFRRLGGSETLTREYTKRGYLVTQIVSKSPDRQTKVIRKYTFQ